MKKLLIKTSCLLLILGLNWTGLFAIGETFAHFNDTEIADVNIFQTGVLDFSLTSGQGNFITTEKADNMGPGDSVTRDIYIKKDGSLPFKYQAHSESIPGSCDEDFYNALELRVWYNYYHTQEPSPPDYHEYRTMALKYSGPLKDFDDFDTNPDDSDLIIPNNHPYFNNSFYQENEHWLYFEISLPSDVSADLQNKACEFKFIFEGWQDNVDNYGDGGFTDVEEITNTLQSGTWIVEEGDVVINELMWMGSWFKSHDEWIELRNMTSHEIDISGWQLTKLTDCGEVLMLEIPEDSTIPANGYFLISNFDKEISNINVEPDLVDLKVSLRNRFLQIKLYKEDWEDSDNLIDTADNGSYLPAAGWQGFFFHLSMERNDIPGDGTLSNSWHTCFDFVNSRIYWDSNDIFNLGTPGAANLSDESIEGQEAYLAYYIQLEKELLDEGVYPVDPISWEENYDEEEVLESENEPENVEEKDIFEDIIDVVEETVEEILGLNQEDPEELVEEEIVEEDKTTEETKDEVGSETEEVPEEIIQEETEELIEEDMGLEENTDTEETGSEVDSETEEVPEEIIEEEQPVIEPEEIIIEEENNE